VRSFTTTRFWETFGALPIAAQRQGRAAYRLFQENPFHPSLQFKQVHRVRSIYSVRIGLHYRALGVRDGEEVVWYWAGTHAEYDRIVAQL
jgi:hypothetical protein